MLNWKILLNLNLFLKEKNEKKAIEYFEKCADLNDPTSFYLLSISLEDKEKSFKYLEKSAELIIYLQL